MYFDVLLQGVAMMVMMSCCVFSDDANRVVLEGADDYINASHIQYQVRVHCGSISNALSVNVCYVSLMFALCCDVVQHV